MDEKPRIGVYVCHCGLNIAGVVDVASVAEYAATLPNVVVAKDYMLVPGEIITNQVFQSIIIQWVIFIVAMWGMVQLGLILLRDGVIY